ncbi:response regulator [Halorubrum distributum]|uniref:response regulator n=1 Tax=Halorubrum distributum TaxID=29283 RepID=UPI0012690662|nr:response regulator [Halorubrum arcis]
MSEYLIWWIDDNQDGEREKAANTLGEHLQSLSVKYSYPQDASEILSSNEYPDVDLILIDWKLNENEGVEYTAKGLTMAATVREQLVDTPIYGFSSESLETWSSPATDEQFQERLELNRLDSRNSAERLRDDIEDYRAIEDARGDEFGTLVATLNPPEDSESELKALIPREFSSGLKSDNTKRGGSRVEFAEWVSHRFLQTPGPLLNDTWTATRLGIDKESFESYIEILYDADVEHLQYDGIFSHSHERLWWSSELVSAIVDLNTSDSLISQLNKDAPEILGVSEDDIAECSLCGGQYPDTVAAVMEGEDAEEPTHYRCSHVHHSREGSFEDYRVVSETSQ